MTSTRTLGSRVRTAPQPPSPARRWLASGTSSSPSSRREAPLQLLPEEAAPGQLVDDELPQDITTDLRRLTSRYRPRTTNSRKITRAGSKGHDPTIGAGAGHPGCGAGGVGLGNAPRSRVRLASASCSSLRHAQGDEAEEGALPRPGSQQLPGVQHRHGGAAVCAVKAGDRRRMPYAQSSMPYIQPPAGSRRGCSGMLPGSTTTEVRCGHGR